MLFTFALAFLAAVELPSHGQGLRPPSPQYVNASDTFEIQTSRFSKATRRRTASSDKGASKAQQEQVWLPRSPRVTITDFARFSSLNRFNGTSFFLRATAHAKHPSHALRQLERPRAKSSVLQLACVTSNLKQECSYCSAESFSFFLTRTLTAF
jgi:hypothetical protein